MYNLIHQSQTLMTPFTKINWRKLKKKKLKNSSENWYCNTNMLTYSPVLKDSEVQSWPSIFRKTILSELLQYIQQQYLSNISQHYPPQASGHTKQI